MLTRNLPSKFIFPFIILLILIIQACKKDKTLSSTEKLTGTWTLTDVRTPDVSNSVSLYANIPPCVKDDIYQFNSDGSFTISEGAIACYGTAVDQGTWSISNNDKELDLEGTGGPKIFNIISLGADSMTLSGNYVFFLSGPFNYIGIYRKK